MKICPIGLVLFIFLPSCAPISSTIPASPIAGCGGGIERSITANIEAEYSKASLSGKVDAGFVDTIRAAFDAKGASEDKFNAYLACFQNVDARVREDARRTQCLAGCDSSQLQCMTDQKSEYDQCIRKGQSNCMIQCYTVFNLSKSQCNENCRADKPHNIGTWERNYSCQTPSGARCTPSVSNCRAECNK